MKRIFHDESEVILMRIWRLFVSFILLSTCWGCDHGFPGASQCGDGLVQGDEECDDGNTVSNDGCNAACVVEEGWACDEEPSLCETVCGDEIVAGDEVCDDGNTIDGDGCRGDCLSLGSCGDGTVDPGEGCDDGKNGDDCDGCTDDCQVFVNVCGDGVVCGDEECDDGANGDVCDGCTDECQEFFNACGDGVRCDDEVCDGEDLGGAACGDIQLGDGTEEDATSPVEVVMGTENSQP